MPDHIHLFVGVDPFDSPTNIVKVFNGVTGLKTRKFPDLDSRSSSFWATVFKVVCVVFTK